MVSMKDIAKRCGVSIATVSKSLNDCSDIGDATRQRVREAARELGYFPNSSARALKTRRTYNLGVLFVDDARSGLTHDFFSHILESFKVTAEARGYDITFTGSTTTHRKMTYLEHCNYRGVDGVVIACIDFKDPAVQELIQSSLPVVTIDYAFDNRIAVVSDNRNGMRQLMEYVCGKGHRKIAYIHGADSASSKARIASYYEAMQEHHLQVPEEYVMEAAYRDVKGTREATEKLMNLPDPPTCILYPDDISCIGGMNYLIEHGYRIGKDISIAGYDGVFLSSLLSPQITTIWQDTGTIGRVAAEKLISLIEHPKDTKIESILVGGKLQVGGSVADIDSEA